MAIETALWKVGQQPSRLSESALASESLLESMICASPELLSDEWMIVGQQEHTGYSGRIDLLAIAPDTSLVLIELKKDRTPREVVAQAIDYAGWVEKLTAADVEAMYRRYSGGGSLTEDFKQKFGIELTEDSFNESHQIVVVASSLDASTERIIDYLRSREIAINVLFFQVFTSGEEQLLSRLWLADPAKSQAIVSGKQTDTTESWNGEYYGSFGEDSERSWEDAREYGFFSAGGGVWYTRTLGLLKPGDRIWVKIPGKGFVGVGRVLEPALPAKDFLVPTANGMKSLINASSRAAYLAGWADNEKREVVVPVKWLQTVPSSSAFNEIGLFGNQNSVCQPIATKWRTTVERLKSVFQDFDKDGK